MKTRSALVPLVALSIAAAVLAPAAPAAAAPVITVTSVVDPEYPQQVPTAASGETTRITVTVSSSEPLAQPATATATATYGGLAVTNPVQPLGTLAQPVTISFNVAGTESGVHSLFVDVTAPNILGGGTTIPWVYTTGSLLQAGTNPLYERSFGWEGTEHTAGLESSTRSVQMLSIVSKTYAFVGLPAHGLPSCQDLEDGCIPYAYDHVTNLLQVGTGIIAAPHDSGLYTDGLIPADEQDGELFGRHDFDTGISPTNRRSELSGTYAYSSRDYPTGLTYEKVTFRNHHAYSLAYAVDGGKVKKLSGTYRLGGRGAISFRVGRKTRQLGTVLLATRKGGIPQPSHLGLWLVLSGPKGRTPDGNLLLPKKK